MSQQPPYQLAFALQGHAADVRGLSAPNPALPLLLSASRDGSAIVWGPSKQGGDWDVKLRVEGPEKRFVSCVGMTRWNNEALLLVGSSSGILSSYILPSGMSSSPDEVPEPYHTLVEHKQNLCCLDTSPNGLIATGSWDKSVLVWKDFSVAIKIEKHEQAVWAVRFVGEDKLLTAAADNKIILHSLDVASGKSKVVREYTGHTQPVRGLSLRTDGKGFWSCGNDGAINLYSFDKAAPIRTLTGHTSFVYSITAMPDGSGAITSGEDGTLRVWSETELLQTIPHPNNSLWSTTAVAAGNGSTYIVSSSQDAVIRFFTRDPTLAAPATVKERWDQEVSSRQLDKSQVGDVKHSDLPGLGALGREGKKDGQVIMIKNNGAVEAYSWTAATSTWQQVGTVVDAIGQGRKQLYEGKEYDYVFDVDVSEGMPPLKLPFNVSENPWVAAQKFLEKNELPSSYLDQVVSFIEKNTGGVSLGQADAQTFVDPYTGASRYTGASSSSQPSVVGGDPFTGSSAYSSTPAPPPQAAPGVLPVKSYLSFSSMNVNAVKGKIAQLNQEVKATTPDVALTSEDETMLSEIYAILSSAKPTKTTIDGDRLISLIEQWPEAQRFPFIDLARCLALTSPSLAKLKGISYLFAACCWDEPWQATKARETNTLLVLRTFANFFQTPAGRKIMVEQADLVLSSLQKRTWEEVGARKQPYATVILNYSASAVNGDLPSEAAAKLLDLIVFVLENESQDAETLYRASVALGNLLSSPKIIGGLQVGNVQKAKGLVKQRAAKLGEKRLTNLSKEIDRIAA